MLIKNPLKMNNWEISKFLTIIFAIQISVLGLIGLDLIGLKIPFLREFLSVIYIIFVPGILILRTLKLHEFSSIETLLFTVGLSIVTLMFMGFFINLIYPFLGISKPISLFPIIITLSSFVLLMSILSYFIDRDFNNPSYIEFNISSQVLFLCIMPILSILGSTYFYFYNKSTITLFMLLLVSLTVLLIGFKKFITPKYYPLAIVVISISLLYHTWLISPFVFGRDIISELSTSKFVLVNSYWNFNTPLNMNYILPQNANAMLIISNFPPIISIIGNININNVYNIIFPLIISLTPLGLYELFKKQTNKQIAFLSAFLFITMGFYNVVLISVKQSMATFFIVLLLLCLIRKNNMKISVLSILFLISIVTCHYGTTYLLLFILSVALIIDLLTKKIKPNNFLLSKFKIFDFNSETKNKINFTIVILFLTITLGWYIYVSNGHVFETLVNIGNHISSSIYDEFLNSKSTEGLGLVLTDPTTISGYFYKAIILMIQGFIFLGIFWVFFKDKMKFKPEFIFMAIPALLLNIFSVIIPNFSRVIYTPRMYDITLVFLAPFALIGGIYFFDKIKISKISKKSGNGIKILSIILVSLFLLEVGAVKEIVNEPGISIPLSKERMMNSNIVHKSTFYSDYAIFEQNYYSVTWLSNNKINATIYSDQPSSKALSSYNVNLMLNWQEYSPPIEISQGDVVKLRKLNYFYLSYSNIKGGLWLNHIKSKNNPRKIQDIQPLLNNQNKIYSNGGSDIYVI